MNSHPVLPTDEPHLWQHGNSRVPSTSKNLKLSQWVAQQRLASRKGKLLEARRALLDNFAFVWEPGEDSWNRKYAELATFAVKNGHCNLPQTDHIRQPTENKLGQWMNKQVSTVQGEGGAGVWTGRCEWRRGESDVDFLWVGDCCIGCFEGFGVRKGLLQEFG